MDTIVIFGRQPVAGRVKTRLAAGLGDEAAAAVYEVLLHWTLQVALGTGVHCVLSLAEPARRGWEPPRAVATVVQRPGDLGMRLGAAFEHRFGVGDRRVVVIGSDCPHLRPEHLVAAFEVLDRVPVVLGPARDGGYWLVGQVAPGGHIFQGVPFSTPRALRATRGLLQETGMAWQELAELDDIDTVSDLDRCLDDANTDPLLRRRLREASARAPATSPSAGVPGAG